MARFYSEIDSRLNDYINTCIKIVQFPKQLLFIEISQQRKLQIIKRGLTLESENVRRKAHFAFYLIIKFRKNLYHKFIYFIDYTSLGI